MRHTYNTRGIVLSRTSIGEAHLLVTILTKDLGIVHARAQSIRRSGAKLAAPLVTFAESDVILVRGKDIWRVSGAVFGESWFTRLSSIDTRRMAIRVSGLLLRLVAGEELEERALFAVIQSFFVALANAPQETCEAIEILAVLQLLGALGVDAGPLPEGTVSFTPSACAEVLRTRCTLIARINNGIAASGL